jgi:hypothetical protein
VVDPLKIAPLAVLSFQTIPPLLYHCTNEERGLACLCRRSLSRPLPGREGLGSPFHPAYRSDLKDLAGLLAPRKTAGPPSAEDLNELLPRLPAGGALPALLARRVASLRNLFRFLLREGRIDHDPSAGIHCPRGNGRICRSTCRAIRWTALLAAPPAAKPPASATGPCSNCSTPAASASPNSPTCPWPPSMPSWVYPRHGKGGKHRFVPAGQRALNAIENYLAGARPSLLKGPPLGRVVCHRARRPDDPPGLLEAVATNTVSRPASFRI